MTNGINITLGDDIMPPASPIEIKIDYLESNGSASRVFDIASELIRAFEDLDRVLITSIDSKISTQMILEDLEKSSVRIILSNLLKKINDDALKDLDWKKQVGVYLVKAKYAAIEFLDKDLKENPKIEDLTDTVRGLAQETDVRHMPDYPKINPYRIAQSMDRIQKVKEKFKEGEGLTITLGEEEYSVNLKSTWLPSEHMEEVETEAELSNEINMILIIRKPDLLGHTKWQFRHGKKAFSAPIEDEVWIKEFHNGQHPITPGQALRVIVRYDYQYDKKGDLTESKETIIKVIGLVELEDPPKDLFDK